MKTKHFFLAVCLAISMAAVCALGAQDNSAKLRDAIAWLNKVQAGFSPQVKKDVPALQAILTRYFTEPDTLRASEEQIAVAFLATMPTAGDVGTRGGNLDKMQEFEALMGSSKPSPKPSAGHSKPKPPPTPKHRIPGVSSKPAFVAERVQAPGGKSIGAVKLAISGHSKTVVEVLTPAPNMDVFKRAQVVAKRMQKLSGSNRLWWTMLRPTQVRGEYVVGVGRGSDFVITADKAFAKEWGVSTQDLAKQLVLKIRSAMDAEKSETFGGRDLSPEDLHLAAVDLRQQGDAAFMSSPGQAEAKYNQAIASDPTYSVPYLRLADLYVARHDSAAAKAILDKALGVDGMGADQKADVQRKRSGLGA